MAMKSKVNGLNTMHTAGIFSDMTVDGPEIGTLVVIVDRAKNLPNRKTIGKQDPYCAARLGKEAKKTDTDRRGGQTPRWDQELRFTVHDSPDYYQLKVSVFNDDKKTDLIGETWVDLKDVVIPGGGQNDLWHNLGCKGKYAGEIRIEITYYDTRPKQEKPEKVKQAGVNGVEDPRDSLKGPRQPKAPIKKRPLPSDPVTGAPAPVVIPDHVQTPPRGFPPSPTVAPDYGQTPPRGYQSPSVVSDHSQTPPRNYQNPPSAIPEHIQTPTRGYQPPSSIQNTVQTPTRGYQNSPSALPEHVQTPQRGYQSPSYIPNQSPLQSVEYNTQPSHFTTSQAYDSSPQAAGYGQSPGGFSTAQTHSPIPDNRYDLYDSMPRNGYSHGDESDRYEDENIDPRDHYNSQQMYELPQPDEYGSPPSPGGPPPPPPAHRSRNGSSHVSPAPPMNTHGSYGFPDPRISNQYNTPPHEAHRHSMPSYSQNNSYQAYSPDREQNQFRNSTNGGYQDSPPRHHSYDARYNNDHGSMQPTVEDAPPSPGGGNYGGHRVSGTRNSAFDDRRYDQVPSPAPLNLSGRGSASSGRNSTSTPNYQPSGSSLGYTSNNSQVSYRERSRDRSHTNGSVSSRNSYNPQEQRPRGRSQNEMATTYGLPPVPATLVAGMDPTIAQEISDRIYDEKRASFSQSSGYNARGRTNDPYQHNGRKLLSYHEPANVPFVPAAATYDDRQSRFSTATVPVVKPRAISPDPRRVPVRKSVSPSPAPSEDQRRLSGIPFGPDSYNALNPSVSGSKSATSLSAAYDTKPIDPDAKIITHDGREVDPSDHIPESNYAPLLEKKGPKQQQQQQQADRGYHSPQNQQPLSSTGRRPLRQAGRPQSMAASSPIYINNASPDPATPTSRNRLQKKSNRMSAQPAPHSSPLAPLTPYQDNSYTPKSQPRRGTMDYHPNENYSPHYGNGGGYRGTAGPPPIPDKVPIAMSGPPQPAGADAWALLEEMKNIDLGSGRARRRY